MSHDGDGADAVLLAHEEHARLLAKYEPIILGRCIARLQGHPDAEDVAQDAKRVAVFLLLLALAFLLLVFGPLLVAVAVALPDRGRNHPVLLLLLGIAGVRWALRGCRQTVQP